LVTQKGGKKGTKPLRAKEQKPSSGALRGQEKQKERLLKVIKKALNCWTKKTKYGNRCSVFVNELPKLGLKTTQKQGGTKEGILFKRRHQQFLAKDGRDSKAFDICRKLLPTEKKQKILNNDRGKKNKGRGRRRFLN